MHFRIQSEAHKASQSSPLVKAESGDPTESHNENTRTRRFSLPRLPSRSVMNLPNISISSFVQSTARVDHENSSNSRGEASGTSPGHSDRSTLSDRHEEPETLVDTEKDGHNVLLGLDRGGDFGSAVTRPGHQQRPETVAHRHGFYGGVLEGDTSARLGGSATFINPRTAPSILYGRTLPATQSLPSNDAVSVHSDNIATSFHDGGRSLEPIGKWRCCKCHKGHEIYNFAIGEHPVSVLNCVCTHRSCTNCTLDGLIKRFQPMNEPEVVQLSEDESKQIRFGVFCDGCGLSWRAQEVENKAPKKSTLQRISAMPKRLAKCGVHPLEKLRHSQSMSDLSCPRPDDSLPASHSTLNLRALSSEMEKGHGKQAELTTVNFTGIQCTCGLVTCALSLCFQVVDPPKDFHEVKFAKLVAERKVASFTSTPEDQVRGHGTPMLHLKGGSHVNPLMSNPITESGSIV